MWLRRGTLFIGGDAVDVRLPTGGFNIDTSTHTITHTHTQQDAFLRSLFSIPREDQNVTMTKFFLYSRNQKMLSLYILMP